LVAVARRSRLLYALGSASALDASEVTVALRRPFLRLMAQLQASLSRVMGWQRRLGMRATNGAVTARPSTGALQPASVQSGAHYPEAGGFIDRLLKKYFADQVSLPVIG
jgi:hypothetical protein